MSEKSPSIEDIVSNVHKNYILDGDADIIDYMVKACEKVRNQIIADVEKIIKDDFEDCIKVKQDICIQHLHFLLKEIKNLKVKND